jgi:adenosyl cobinamide kinase/adenosyl cobinamide phosphate guanylyltransferase
MIGLFGSQRSGKSTLAKTYADKHDIAFVETSASVIFKEMGLDPAVTYDFATRMAVQDEILTRFNEIYFASPRNSITDRTPIDLMAYTLSECLNDNVPKKMETRVEKYIAACFKSLNMYFSTVILVQPGIPLKKAKGKAGISKAHIEHISTICLGLSVDERLKVPHFYLPRRCLDMPDRIAAVEGALGRVSTVATRHLEEYVANGNLIH